MTDCDCQDCEELLQPYVDRGLTESEREGVRAHLDRCESCRRCYRLEERLRRHVKRCCDEPMPEQLKARLLSLRTPL